MPAPSLQINRTMSDKGINRYGPKRTLRSVAAYKRFQPHRRWWFQFEYGAHARISMVADTAPGEMLVKGLGDAFRSDNIPHRLVDLRYSTPRPIP